MSKLFSLWASIECKMDLVLMQVFALREMATRTRLSEAHQFFEGQDAETQNADTDTTSERVKLCKILEITLNYD